MWKESEHDVVFKGWQARESMYQLLDMKNTKNIVLSLTKHAKKQAKVKGFPVDNILKVWEDPERIISSRSYPGQYRVCGNGICLVGVKKNRQFIVITLYVDEELTPPRPDQMRTKAGRKYAEKYWRGEGR